MRRILKQNRLQRFLSSSIDEYKEYRKRDLVLEEWNRFKKIDIAARKFTNLLRDVAERKHAVETDLKWIPRFGWDTYLDEGGYPYYVDRSGAEEATYEMPSYTFDEWRVVHKVQAKIRIMLKRKAAEREYRENQKLLMLEKSRANWAEELAAGQKLLHFKLKINDIDLSLYQPKLSIEEETDADITEDDNDDVPGFSEDMLPINLQFEDQPHLTPGMWCLLQPPGEDASSLVSCIILKVAATGQHCDVRTIKGKKYERIAITNVFQPLLDVGRRVEVRYQGRKLFFRGRIHGSIVEGGERLYHVLYDDGDEERKIPRDLIRMCGTDLPRFLADRTKFVANLDKRIQRKQYYHNLAKDRRKKWGKAYAYEVKLIAARSKARVKKPRKKKRPSSSDSRPDTANTVSSDGMGDMGEEVKEAPGIDVSPMDVSLLEAKQFTERFDDDDQEEDSEDEEEPFEKVESSSSIIFNRKALAYGWFLRRNPFDKHKTYENRITGSTTRVPPNYIADEHVAVLRIQSVWAVHQARKKIQAILHSESLEQICKDAINRYQKEAYIGHRLEGLTALMILKRAGQWELATGLEGFYRTRPTALARISTDYLVNLKQEKWVTVLGQQKEDALSDFKKFQEWYKKSTIAQREIALGNLIYYSGPMDPRDIQKVLIDGEKDIMHRLQKAYPNSVTKIKSIWRELVKDPKHPIARRQMDFFLTKYSGKPGLALDNVKYLTKQQITHTWKEEEKAYAVLRLASLRILAIVANKGLALLADVIRTRVEAAEAIVRGEDPLAILKAANGRKDGDVKDQPPPPSKKRKGQDGKGKGKIPAKGKLKEEKKEKIDGYAKYKKSPGKSEKSSEKGNDDEEEEEEEEEIPIIRDKVTGPEAKAALLLRREVLQFVLESSKAIVIVQREIRAFTQRCVYKKRLKKYYWAIDLTHRFARGYLGRCIGAWYRQQKEADWEQLWNPSRQLLYYYSKQLGLSTYEEPRDGVYRPLVRDRRSARLVQAWPSLDEGERTDDGFLKSAAPPESVALSKAMEMCGICMFRKSVRVCFDCMTYPHLPDGTVPTDWQAPTAYCFICYSRAHQEPDMQKHNYQDRTEPAEESRFLLCCLCQAPAVRKCQGGLSDSTLQSMLADFEATPVAEWGNALNRWEIQGAKKISLLLERIKPTESDSRSGVKAGFATKVQLNQLKVALDAIRTECDECYCTACYKKVHRGGKRQHHKWLGFREYGTACSACMNAPATLSCENCGNVPFCAACDADFHAKGRKRHHERSVIKEELNEGEELCLECDRRAAYYSCEFCLSHFCDSCYECTHKGNCNEQPNLKVTFGTKPILECVACGEIADQRCKQCKDCYCSLTWMGNPGCFYKFHSSGVMRKKHTTEPLVLQMDGTYCHPVEEDPYDTTAKKK